MRRHQAQLPHQVWVLDFQFDATADGRRLKFLSLIDGHSLLPLATRVDRRCKARDVEAVLEELTSVYPAPPFIRIDNGLEFNCFAEAWRLRPGPTGLVRGQQHHQHGHLRASIPVGEWLCGIVQWLVPGRVPQHRAVHHGS